MKDQFGRLVVIQLDRPILDHVVNYNCYGLNLPITTDEFPLFQLLLENAFKIINYQDLENVNLFDLYSFRTIDCLKWEFKTTIEEYILNELRIQPPVNIEEKITLAQLIARTVYAPNSDLERAERDIILDVISHIDKLGDFQLLQELVEGLLNGYYLGCQEYVKSMLMYIVGRIDQDDNIEMLNGVLDRLPRAIFEDNVPFVYELMESASIRGYKETLRKLARFFLINRASLYTAISIYQNSPMAAKEIFNYYLAEFGELSNAEADKLLDYIDTKLSKTLPLSDYERLKNEVNGMRKLQTKRAR